MWFKYGLGASALYLCFTLRPAIFNSLRSVTVGEANIIALAFGVLLSCVPILRTYNLYCLHFFPKPNASPKISIVFLCLPITYPSKSTNIEPNSGFAPNLPIRYEL